MTNSFKDYYYLTESKNTYVFKIKLIGEHQSDCVSKLKEALSKYKVISFSEGKRSPIQETQVDFPMYKNTNVTTFDVSLGYPITSVQLLGLISETINIPLNSIKVRSQKEEEEELINHQHDEKTGKTLLGSDYESENNQDVVGEKHVMNFLKELNKDKKHQGTQYKGINDEILAKKVPVDKAIGDAVKPVKQSKSPVGSNKIQFKDPKK